MELEMLSSIADFIQTPVSVIAVGVTAWAAWSATRAAKAAEHSVEENRKTTRDQLRAYVLIEGAELSYELNGVKSPHPFVGAHAVATIRCKNTGQTPAKDVIVRTTIAIRSLPLDASSLTPKLDLLMSRSNIGSGSEKNNSATHPIPLPQEGGSDLDNKKIGIFVFGEITYLDVFNKRHSTKFRLFNSSRKNGAMTFCDDGNDFD